MRSFEIFVAPPSDEALTPLASIPSGARAAAVPSPLSVVAPSGAGSRGAREVLDIFIGGANVTAIALATEPKGKGSPAPTAASVGGVVRDLATALVELVRAPRGKRIVRFYDDPWELCIQRWDEVASLSVYRGGSEPVVAVYERAVPFHEVVSGACDAVESLLSRPRTPSPLKVELGTALAELSGFPPAPLPERLGEIPACSTVVVEADASAPFSLAAELAIREVPRSTAPLSYGRGAPTVERTDMHALLFRGKVRAHVRDREVDLGDGHPFLLAERLVDVSKRVLDAWERGAAWNLRTDAGGVLIGARLGVDGVLALTLVGRGSPARSDAVHTFPALTVPDVVEASLSFGRSIARALLRRDRAQSSNLRLSAFRRQLKELDALLREACRDDSKTNPSPESYRAFVAPRRAPSLGAPSRGDGNLGPARLRYSARWRALVPGIDLRATFLCGDRFIVGGLDETFGLDRVSGEVLWRVPTEKAISVVTPGGIARLRPDGELSVHDFGTGEVTLRSWLAPRVGGLPAGAVVNVPGLPRLLIVTEGEKHLVAIDLTSGEPRWRFAWGGRGALRLKRAGKLLYYTSGDSALTALDVLTGAIVWRARDRLRFRTPPTLDHDLLFATAGGAGSRAEMHAFDPFSGEERWAGPVAPDRDTCSIEGSAEVVGDVVISAVRERHSLRLVAKDRESGEHRWASPAVAPAGTSWLPVDDLLIGNTPTGELLGIEGRTGELRYRHVLGTVLETDVPRKLEPVLRSGALFVPHSNVHVFRPRDGRELGVIGPCEAIPDLLRVDEKCDVYLAEESGHVVSFAVGPRLSLVKG